MCVPAAAETGTTNVFISLVWKIRLSRMQMRTTAFEVEAFIVTQPMHVYTGFYCVQVGERRLKSERNIIF